MLSSAPQPSQSSNPSSLPPLPTLSSLSAAASSSSSSLQSLTDGLRSVKQPPPSNFSSLPNPSAAPAGGLTSLSSLSGLTPLSTASPQNLGGLPSLSNRPLGSLAGATSSAPLRPLAPLGSSAAPPASSLAAAASTLTLPSLSSLATSIPPPSSTPSLSSFSPAPTPSLFGGASLTSLVAGAQASSSPSPSLGLGLSGSGGLSALPNLSSLPWTPSSSQPAAALPLLSSLSFQPSSQPPQVVPGLPPLKGLGSLSSPSMAPSSSSSLSSPLTTGIQKPSLLQSLPSLPPSSSLPASAAASAPAKEKPALAGGELKRGELPPKAAPASASRQRQAKKGLLEEPSELGKVICGVYEQRMAKGAEEAYQRVLFRLQNPGAAFDALKPSPSQLPSFISLNALLPIAGENKGGVTIFGFDTPSPDDVVTNARLKKDSAPASSPSSPFAKTPVSKPQASHPADSPRSQLSAGLNPSKGSASVPSTPTERDPGTPKGKRPEEISKTLPKNVKITKMKVNIQEEFAERKKGKETLNLVVVGHVDAGKSTLMGHLLYLLGEVSQKIMNKHERESQKIGKSSFAFAWALDETEEERKRGITMDIATRKFETENRRVTLLDAPGHRDFIPNMISGAAQADVSILVVDATTGEFEAGFEADGQTKEHSLLIRSLGVSQVVVAINKLDNMKWSKERYDEIIGKLLPFLKQSGFKDKNVTFVPCSGLTGENLVKREAPELCVWYTGPTLIQSIDAFQPPERSIDKPLRISVSDIFKSANAGGISVSGRIEAGYISKDDQILIMPGNTVVTVKSIEIHDQPTKLAVAGENVVLNLAGLEREQIGNSSILCEASAPIRVVSSFVAQILVFDVKIPVTKGDTVVLHFLSMNEQSTITKLVGILDKSSGEIKQKNPRFLPKNSTAVVEIKMGKPICMETYKDLKELGRFTLRSAGKTIAAGVVQEIRE